MRRAFVLGIPLAFLAAACSYDNGDARRVLYNDTLPASCNTPVESAIDTDQQIAIDAGVGAGVFIEYASGGHYHVRTSCDTTRSQLSCNWDVIISPEAGLTISNVAGENLTGADGVYPYRGDASGSYELTVQTSTEVDGVTFDVEPGAAVTVDAFLDGTCALPFFFWVGDGALHQGSPSNPLTVRPSSD